MPARCGAFADARRAAGDDGGRDRTCDARFVGSSSTSAQPWSRRSPRGAAVLDRRPALRFARLSLERITLLSHRGLVAASVTPASGGASMSGASWPATKADRGGRNAHSSPGRAAPPTAAKLDLERIVLASHRRAHRHPPSRCGHASWRESAVSGASWPRRRGGECGRACASLVASFAAVVRELALDRIAPFHTDALIAIFHCATLARCGAFADERRMAAGDERSAPRPAHRPLPL